MNLYDHFLSFPEQFDTAWFGIFDLNNDGESEIILQWTFYVSISSVILYFDKETNSYQNTIWIQNGLQPRDLDKDGLLEFYLRDEQFNIVGLMGAHMIRVVSPVRILRFSDGEIVNVSEQYPNIVEADAANWFSQIIEFEGCDIWGWGAYIANMHTINRAEEAWQIYSDYCENDGYFSGQKELITNALIDFGYLENSE